MIIKTPEMREIIIEQVRCDFCEELGLHMRECEICNRDMCRNHTVRMTREGKLERSEAEPFWWVVCPTCYEVASHYVSHLSTLQAATDSIMEKWKQESRPEQV